MSQKISIGGLMFDAVIKTDHTSKLTATSHPIESGVSVVNNVIIEPTEISIEIGMTDCNGVGASSKMFKDLQAMQFARQGVTVVTRFKTYRNMLIMAMSVPDDYTTMYSLKAILMLREVPVIVNIPNSDASVQPQKNISTNRGTTQPAQNNQSVLRQAATMLRGV
jgi:hypothetical protein